MALRFDTGSLGKVERTPQGGLRVPANVSRVGVLEYSDGAGRTWAELVPPDELFRADSLATLADAPVTKGHPSTLVTRQTFKQVSVGSVRPGVRRDGEFAAGTLVVQDDAAVVGVERGELVECSAGYVCEIDPTPGTFQGAHYDAIQRNRRYNHVALLPEGAGRAGPDVGLRMDAATRAAHGGDVGFAVRADDLTPAPARDRLVEAIRGAFRLPELAGDDAVAASLDRLATLAAAAPEAREGVDVDAVLESLRWALALPALADAATVIAQARTALGAATTSADARAATRSSTPQRRATTQPTTEARADAAATETRSMKTIKFNGRVYRCDDAGDMAQLQTDMDAAGADAQSKSAQLDAVMKQLADLLAQIATLQAKVKSLEEADAGADADPAMDAEEVPEEVLDAAGVKRDPKRPLRLATKLVDALVAAREQLRTDARKVLGVDAKLAGKSAREIKREVLAKVAPTLRLDSLDARGLDMMFRGVIAGYAGAPAAKRTDSEDALARARADAEGIDPKGRPETRTDDAGARTDAGDEQPDASAAQRRMNQRMRDAWKPKQAAGR